MSKLSEKVWPAGAPDLSFEKGLDRIAKEFGYDPEAHISSGVREFLHELLLRQFYASRVATFRERQEEKTEDEKGEEERRQKLENDDNDGY